MTLTMSFLYSKFLSMTKTKAPLLSLGASGTVADAITYSRRRKANIMQAKPKLPYFLTLPSQYQRWLYSDYIYQWHQLTPAQKQTYQSAGVRYHLTGFQYWMKYNLANLPDIAGYWKLDDNRGAITIDSSRNNYHGTIIGASPSIGRIDQALSFDGVNDYVDYGFIPTNTITSYTIFLWLKTTLNQNSALFTNDRIGPLVRGSFFLGLALNSLYHSVFTTIGQFIHQPAQVYNDGNWHFVVFRYDGSIIETFYDNTNLGNVPATGTLIQPVANTLLGARDNIPVSDFYSDIIDHVLFYTRALTDTELTQHFSRRWPH